MGYDYNKTAQAIIDEFAKLIKERDARVEALTDEEIKLSAQLDKIQAEREELEDIELGDDLEKKWVKNQENYVDYLERELKKILTPLGLTKLDEVTWEDAAWDAHPDYLTDPKEQSLSFRFIGDLKEIYYADGKPVKNAEQELNVYRRAGQLYEAPWEMEYELSRSDHGDSAASYSTLEEMLKGLPDDVKQGRWFDCPKCKDLDDADDDCKICLGAGNVTQLELEERVSKDNKKWYNESYHSKAKSRSLSEQTADLLNRVKRLS
jgi:hypothetical protein